MTATSPTSSFQGVRNPSRAAVGALAGGIVASAVLIVAHLAERSLLTDLRNGAVVSTDRLNSVDRLLVLSSACALVIGAGVLVSLIVWLRRIVANATVLGVGDTRWGPGWAIGAWFVPLANLVLPYLVVRSAWRRTTSTPEGIAAAWWLAWVTGVIANRGGSANRDDALEAADLQSGIDATVLLIAGASLFAVSAVLGILLVRRLTQLQEDRAAVLGLRRD